MEKPFQGLRTFLKAGTEPTADTRFWVVGAPMDCATTNRPGARFGPSAIREASMMLTDGYHPRWENNPLAKIVDMGDVALSNTNVEKSLKQITDAFDDMVVMNKLKGLRDFHPITLGGDHSITLGIMRSLYKQHGKIGIVHFDAHSDCSIDHLGDPVGHGTWMRNVIDEGLVDPKHVVSIGIRAPGGLHAMNFLTQMGGKTFSARDAMGTHPYDMHNWIIQQMGGAEVPVYLSFDVDGLDPAYAPGTGTPEIGGLSTMWCLDVLERIAGLNWIGMDVVEVSPSYDHSQITALAAATIAWTYACMNDVTQKLLMR